MFTKVCIYSRADIVKEQNVRLPQVAEREKTRRPQLGGTGHIIPPLFRDRIAPPPRHLMSDLRLALLRSRNLSPYTCLYDVPIQRPSTSQHRSRIAQLRIRPLKHTRLIMAPSATTMTATANAVPVVLKTMDSAVVPQQQQLEQDEEESQLAHLSRGSNPLTGVLSRRHREMDAHVLQESRLSPRTMSTVSTSSSTWRP